MKRLGVTLAVLLVVSTAGPLVGTSGAEEHNDPACDPGNIVDNDDLRIWFQGKKGQLQLHKKNVTDGSEDGSYQYKQLAIRELDEGNETVAKLNLENAEPMDSSCEVERTGDWVNVTYTVTDGVADPGLGSDPDTADVTFVYHFNTNSSDAKFDLVVEDWPWHQEGELVYDFEATSDEWDIEAAENGLGFRDNETGEPEAVIEWAPNATATYKDGHEEEARVNSTTEGDEDHVTVNLQFTQASPGYVELDYDPTVAVGPYIIVGDILVSTTAVRQPVRDILATV